MTRQSVLARCILPALVVLTLSGCYRAPIYSVNSVPLADIESVPPLKTIEREIVYAANTLGWSVKRIDDNALAAELILRQHRATVRIDFTAEVFSVVYVDSRNLRHNESGIHPNYNDWVRNLEQAIKARVAQL